MEFRSSTFMPAGCDRGEDAVWYEAHQTADGLMIVAQLGGSPRSVGRPGWIKQYFTKDEAGKSKSLPSTATVLKTVNTPQEALEELFVLEASQFAAKAKLIDIGDVRSSTFGGLAHYAAVEAFSQISFPASIQQAANDFVGDLGIRYLLGLVPRSMLEGAREAVKCYQKHGSRASASTNAA